MTYIDSKSELRAGMRALKRSLSPEYKADASAVIFRKIQQMPEFAEATKIMIYHSLSDEVVTHDIIPLWARNKSVYLPIVEGDDIVVAAYSAHNELQEGCFGILEPSRADIVSESEIDKIDLCIVPAVALSRKGERLGRGKGYYDRFLSRHNITKIGVCFAEQLIDSIPTESTDVLMNFVITDKDFIHIG